MFFPHPQPPPNAPNSKEAAPGSILVVFAYIYICPPHQNPPLYAPPSLPAPTASTVPYPAPTNKPTHPQHPRQPYRHVTKFSALDAIFLYQNPGTAHKADLSTPATAHQPNLSHMPV